MTDVREKRMRELEDKVDKTLGEQVELDALLALDEREEELEEAKAANPVPDPVATAQAAVDTARKAVEDAEAANAVPVPDAM